MPVPTVSAFFLIFFWHHCQKVSEIKLSQIKVIETYSYVHPCADRGACAKNQKKKSVVGLHLVLYDTWFVYVVIYITWFIYVVLYITWLIYVVLYTTWFKYVVLFITWFMHGT